MYQSYPSVRNRRIPQVPQYEGRPASFGQYSIGVRTEPLGGLGIGNPLGSVASMMESSTMVPRF